MQIGTIPVWFGSGRVSLGRSNSDYKAISASQQSWILGLAELGKSLLIRDCDFSHLSMSTILVIQGENKLVNSIILELTIQKSFR